MKVKTALEQISDIAHQLPQDVLSDIKKRSQDWLNGGGGEDDPYIHQQLRYAKNILKIKNERGD